ncbi:transglutaminase domain-containing protein [Alicyclobacillus mali]|uniref:Transglutaminase domain-containing protein n=1 Tax=Alicyclobacillus mali (ex Roth et al. 2021) TaxID=1123961 RepID=A0ABS0F3G5_9BACL|nr:transglutaminase-like domain-containing protein [Alicyclobacillus mali (ex Roth et al. 2021)]MBF8377845.1 transglutaminase domain-containing protein [Alicyclobacillus mali (ex Roth et al. 2021)]
MKDWLDWVLWGVVALSALAGFRRGFERESRRFVQTAAFVAEVAASSAAAVAISRYVRNFVLQDGQRASVPGWLAHLAAFWQQSPRLCNWIVFLAAYLIVASAIGALLAPLGARWIRPRGRVRTLSRAGGLVVGGALGAFRAAAVGAGLFLALQYVSAPALAQASQASPAYRWLSNHVYTPWLRPIAEREMPVLAKGAAQSVAADISLFVVPTGPGEETGILVVPKPVAEKALAITRGITSPYAKARALYEWEIHHVHYDWKKYDDYVYDGKWDAQSPLTTLETGKGVCADYALLYADMAHAVGLTVRIDEGVAVTGGVEGSHAWNEVWIPDQSRYILVDTTWGFSQDAWFDVPPAAFDQTHRLTTRITIYAST